MQQKSLTARQWWLICGSSGVAGVLGGGVHTLYFPDAPVLEIMLPAVAIGAAVGTISCFLAKWLHWL